MTPTENLEWNIIKTNWYSYTRSKKDNYELQRKKTGKQALAIKKVELHLRNIQRLCPESQHLK